MIQYFCRPSSSFHRGGRCGHTQYSDHQPPFGNGVSGHRNTRACSHVSYVFKKTDRCAFIHAFKPSFIPRWYKDGKPVNEGDGLRVAANGQRLLVSRAQISDTARFQCVAANEAGDIQRDFTVVVHGTKFKFLVISGTGLFWIFFCVM